MVNDMKITNYLSEVSESFSNYWFEIKGIIYAVFIFLQIDLDIVKLLSILMICDTALGVIKAIYIDKIRFTFKKLLWGIVSKSTILLIPMILALVSLGLGFNFVWLVQIVLKILIVSEGISAITNILSIKEKRNIENTDYISKLLHAIRNFLTKSIDKLFKQINEK